jgi:pyridoxine 5-phosphate synthase
VARLAVNVDHVATLRQARGIDEPDPAWAAVLAEKAGCDGIIAHLREDRRHVQDRDMQVLKHVVKGDFNMEMAATEEMIGIALEMQPDQCCLVPERREELTTEGGLDVAGNQSRLQEVTAQLNQGGIRVSLFIDPTPEQVKAASMCGAQVVELHTGAYANARGENEIKSQLDQIEDTARLAHKLNIKVAAGHGLNLRNTPPLLDIPEIVEYSIGHSIVGRAVFVGFEAAVTEMLNLVRTSATQQSGGAGQPRRYRRL